jgi:proline dehydrogenase
MGLNRLIGKVLPYMPEKLIWQVSKKYIAGSELSDAIRVIKEMNAKKIMTTIDVLGESIDELEMAETYRKMYLKTIDTASKHNLQTSVSLKPTMFGLQKDFATCRDHIRQIIMSAKEQDIFVRIDMEDSSCTDAELKLFTNLYNKFPAHVGIVLQAYLKRTACDIALLAGISKPAHPVNIRLCKGIYTEDESIAFKTRQAVNNNFIACLRLILTEKLYPAIATHDKNLIRQCREILQEFKLTVSDYEFQMLYGVTPQRRRRLVEAGHRMRVYVPYGREWFRYSTRRLQENPKMVWDVVKGLVLRH